MSISSPHSVLLYVQHLLGIGHLQRSLQLAAALARQDFKVALVSGGLPQSLLVADGVTVHQLPPVYSPDASFSLLLDAKGKKIDDGWRSSRRQQLLALFDSISPRVLITETFPFGRRMMRFELLPLLEAAHGDNNCVQIISSIRDILQPKSKPGRNREICDLVDTYYDHVLVHGDPAIASLEDSFASTHSMSDKIDYSGYVCQSNASLPPGKEGYDEVLVSAGGSATGFRILETALQAKPLSAFADNRWRILVSPGIADSRFTQLCRFAGENTIIERNRSDFSGLMQRARVSISQAGYNTITDILDSTTPAVVIPFAEAGEIEQSIRASRLQERGRLVMLEQQELSPEILAAALARCVELDTSLEVDLDGARNSAAMIATWLEKASR